jgi:endonuclease/exonuclease/phosphatase family metal-dependent hydrolase
MAEKKPYKLNFSNFKWGITLGAGTILGIAGFALGLRTDDLVNIVQQYYDEPAVVETVAPEDLPTFESQETPEHMEPVGDPVETEEPVSLDEKMKVGSFNIQVFGQSKSNKPEVMAALAKIACEFDVMAVQEFRDKEKQAPFLYLDKINETCPDTYGIVLSERLGRSSSKEQYAFYYNTTTTEFIEFSEFTYADPGDLFEREYFSAKFVTGNFSYVLSNNHIKPDDAYDEIEVLLTEGYDAAKSQYSDEDDFIILGDLNADCTYLNESEWEYLLGLSDLENLIPSSADTTVKASDCAYDRILISPGAKEDYTSEFGIIRFDEWDEDEWEGMNQEFAEDISDHFPVWSEFYTNRDTQ